MVVLGLIIAVCSFGLFAVVMIARVNISNENDRIERMQLAAAAKAEEVLLRNRGLCN